MKARMKEMNMIKIFKHTNNYGLKNNVNNWLERHSDYEIKDIKFFTSCIGAMVIYKA